MFVHLRAALVMLALFTLLTGLIYPLAVTGLSQVLLRNAANGSTVISGGKVVGSRLIGQSFVNDRYFHGRPSATTAPDPKDATKTVDAPYNAASSGGSNLGPLSKKLLDRVEADAKGLKSQAGATLLPADAATASGSGLDPHISTGYALLQIARVATARGIGEGRVRQLVEQHVEAPALGFLGEPRVNVLLLNLALDALGSS